MANALALNVTLWSFNASTLTGLSNARLQFVNVILRPFSSWQMVYSQHRQPTPHWRSPYLSFNLTESVSYALLQILQVGLAL
ncbi:hypothetical protein JVU11DRAFT_8254 [Chiua virens]|nr:hypothetical protein JVU11DRAFT_8254 [Chiua virens]